MESKMMELSWGKLDKTSAQIEFGLSFNVYFSVEDMSPALMGKVQMEIKEAFAEMGLTYIPENAPINWSCVYVSVSIDEPMRWFLNVGYLYPHRSGGMDFDDVCLDVDLEGHEEEVKKIILDKLGEELFGF